MTLATENVYVKKCQSCQLFCLLYKYNWNLKNTVFFLFFTYPLQIIFDSALIKYKNILLWTKLLNDFDRKPLKHY